MTLRLAFLVGENLYGTKKLFARWFARALQSAGSEVLLFEMGQPQETTRRFVQFEPMVTLSYHEVIPPATMRGVTEALTVPHVHLIVDPIFYMLHLLNEPRALFCSVDREDLRFISSRVQDRSLFLPHAIPEELSIPPEFQRELEFVFLGSSHDPLTWYSIAKAALSKELCRALEIAAEIVLLDGKISLLQAADRVFSEEKIDLHSVNFTLFMSCLDHYVRGKERLFLLDALSSLRIDLFGSSGWSEIEREQLNGWAAFAENYPQIKAHGPLSFLPAIQKICQARFSINSSPFFREGSHERVFFSLGCGALAITSANRFLEEEFAEGEGVIFYRYGQKEELLDKLAPYVEDEAKRVIAVRRGQEKVAKNHTFRSRAKSLSLWLEDVIERI